MSAFSRHDYRPHAGPDGTALGPNSLAQMRGVAFTLALQAACDDEVIE